MIDKQSYILGKFEGEFNSSGNLHANCPFHDDHTKSFSITEQGLFICGSAACGLRGNFHLFYKRMEGLSWPEVFERLEGKQVAPNLRKYLEVEKKEIVELVNEFPQPPFIEPINSIKYLHDRGLGKDVCDAYGLVYGKDGEFSGVFIGNTLVCPVWDIDGTYRTFQVRYLSQVAVKRWLNPRGSPVQDLLYGGWLINRTSRYLWLVEGASDVWNLFNHKIQSVGLFTKEAYAGQLNRIYKLCTNYDLIPVICLDGDVKEKDILILTNEMSAFNLSPVVVQLQPDEDPGSLSSDRIVALKEEVGDTEWI